MYKVDLHTHSSLSPDGGITPEQYEDALASGLLDCIAVTDHNRIDTAIALNRRHGDKIIIGEEIMTKQGEIIGLFLKEVVPAGLAADETIEAIKGQGGIVYIPHPFETVRKGLHPAILDELAAQIDIIEICNGRALLQDRSAQAVLYAKLNSLTGAAGSDAHGRKGLGRTYNFMKEIPSRDNLTDLLQTASLITDRPKLRALLYPKYNRLRKKMRRG